MVTASLILLGVALLTLALVDRAVRRLPLTPALLYLVAGWCAGAGMSAFNGVPSIDKLGEHMPALVLATEAAVLLSLMAVGLRLRVPPRLAHWRVALLLAGPGVVLTVALGSVAAAMVLGLPWSAALLLAAVLAPTDPVLASEVQIRSEADRDAVRVSLTAEGGLNDGSALPAVMLGLGLMGHHELGALGGRWVLVDIVWSVGGGLLLGLLLGAGLGRLLRLRLRQGERLARDELLYVGTVLLGFGLARWLHFSTFVVVFAAAALLLSGGDEPSSAPAGTLLLKDTDLSQRLQAVGARIERLVEAATVIAVGIALHSVQITGAMIAFGALLVLIVRPMAVLAVVRRQGLAPSQRRLLAWFGIRGVGTLFYLTYALQHGITGELSRLLAGAALTAVSLSIILHGVSSTPLMEWYQIRRGSPR